MKKEIYKTLTTEYARRFNKSAPLQEYPRPQLRRESYFNLNGEWDFAVGTEEPTEYGEKITVPYPPESALSGIERRINEGERLYYRKHFTLPDGFRKERVILHFGAVDQLCRATLNGKPLGEHEGGYLPFSFDVTDCVTDGENELCVIATDELDTTFPYGKQKRDRGGMWYTPVSGIWQTVWLESLPYDAIDSLSVSANMRSVKIRVKSSAEKKKLTLKESGRVYEFTEEEIEIRPESAKLWTPESPYLYYFTLETPTDRIESYFALREIGVGEFDGIKRLTLNGEPYLFNGLLDQGYFPDGIFTPASYEAYADDVRLAKSLGFNMLRKHIKIEPLIFYHLCDVMGIAVFQDMVNNSDYSFFRDTALPTVGIKKLSDKGLHKNEKTREAFRKELAGMISHLQGCPSVLYYTIFNEGWGQFSADENYRLAKSLDPTRIYDATSGWFTQSESDVSSHHVYFKKARLKNDGKRPLVLSEYGGYSYRKEGHLFGSDNYGYSVHKTREDYEAAVLGLFKNEVLPLAETGISALVYTQLSDIEDETNGFVTYDRKYLKVDAEKMRRLNREIYNASYCKQSDTVAE